MARMTTRLTLDLDTPVQRRLKAISALKGTSMRRYCQTAIERELARDEANGFADLPFGHEALDQLAALRAEILGNEVLSGDSVDFIREARDARADM